MIKDERAKQIAAGWYDGDGSHLYKIVCNDDLKVLTYSHWKFALGEVRALMHNGFLYTKADMRSLAALETWIARNIARRFP